LIVTVIKMGNSKAVDQPGQQTAALSDGKVVICLPTYNERENLPSLLTAIRRVVPAAIVLVIDDASPDGTGSLAEQLAALDPKIAVLHRERKEGLGPAYLAGFRYALEVFRPEVLIQMDADFSHPVESLPKMLAALSEYDLVLGTRYIPGGGTENWSPLRQFLSRFGSLYARFWLRLPFRDLTSGFKVWRRSLLESILRYSVSAGGYVFQVETTCLAARLGARITEVPFVFPDRVAGKSKMSVAIALEACWRLPWLAFTLGRVKAGKG
jgi:dolichol-phosphate mannosyltransferase